MIWSFAALGSQNYHLLDILSIYTSRPSRLPSKKICRIFIPPKKISKIKADQASQKVRRGSPNGLRPMRSCRSKRGRSAPGRGQKIQGGACGNQFAEQKGQGKSHWGIHLQTCAYDCCLITNRKPIVDHYGQWLFAKIQSSWEPSQNNEKNKKLTKASPVGGLNLFPTRCFVNWINHSKMGWRKVLKGKKLKHHPVAQSLEKTPKKQNK